MDKTTNDYMTVGEAAEHLGVSAQTLRRWDATGKLKAIRRPGSKYRYYRRADLEPFRLAYSRAQMEMRAGIDVFQSADANIEANDNLREPQKEAHSAVRKHFADSNVPAIIQIPVGCGKTGVIATLPFGIASERVLVIAPNLTIRRGIFEALDIASRECFWAKTRVLSSFTDGPFVAVLDGPDANLHDCTESHFVVTNIQQLASAADRWLPQFPDGFFDMILVDEGHHNVAASWQKVFRRFPNAKVISLTATPFRSDQRPLAGEVIYRYSFTRAMMKGYIKQIHSSNVAPSEIYFTYQGDQRRHTLSEVLELREEHWFRRGVALAPECNRHIAEHSIRRCNNLRAQTGIQHQIIAAACSVDHARQVRSIYEECGYRASEIHSGMDDEERQRILERLRLNQLDCIVQVQMLGEGFDHPRLSVAAIFRPFRSLSPYIQFVGRAMRVVHQGQPDHPDNHGWIVSHVGLNNDYHWADFRELDLDDQRLFHEWVTAEPDDADETIGTGQPRRFDVGMQVDDELVSHFINRTFLDPDDGRVLDEMLGQEVAPGVKLADLVSRDVLQAKLREQLRPVEQVSETPPPSPQRRRRAARQRLRERTNSVVARILNDLAVGRQGREVCRAMRMLRPPVANTQAVTRLLNKAINEFLGVPSGSRRQLSAQQAETALADLDRIGDEVRESIRAAMEGNNNG